MSTRNDRDVNLAQMPEKNSDFVQLTKAHLTEWRKLIRHKPLSAELLMFFIEKMGRSNNAVVCSYKVLMELTGYSRPSVARAIKSLKDGNWIDTVKVGSATAYCVNEKVAWQRANNQRQYAVFSASIIAGAVDQEQGKHLAKEPKQDLKIMPFISRREIAVEEETGDVHTQQSLPFDDAKSQL